MNRTVLLPLLLCLGMLAPAGCSHDTSPGPGPAAGSPTVDATAAPSGRILRRLTRFEYDNTLTDLLHITSSYGQGLPPEDVVNVFDNNAAALVVGPLLAEKAQEAAEQIAKAAVANLTTLVPCSTTPGRDCAGQFVHSFGLRALRRPLTDAEAARYLSLYDQEAADGGFAEGITALIAAMLQSPYFLYRSELGARPTPATPFAPYPLTPYEVATELSYLLWGSMPDDALLSQAAAGTLASPTQIAAAAQRLLQSPRSRPMLDHFVSQWLLLDHLATAAKDATVYPDFTPAIKTAMIQETTTLFASVVAGSGRFAELLTANYSYLSDALADFYHLPRSLEAADQNGLRHTLLPATRAGLLTQGSILATQAKPDNTSPVLRGKLVRVRLLCQDLPPPPAGVNVQLPPLLPNQTNRQRFTAHASNPACSSCHHLMDPIGFGFERYDAVGRYGETLGGASIDDSGQVLDSQAVNGPFAGVIDLETRLATAKEVQACLARQWFIFGYGIEPDAGTAALLTQIQDGFTQSGASLPALILALTQTPRFVQRDADPDVSAPGTPPAGPPPDMAAPAPDLGPPPPPPSQYHGDLTLQSDWQVGYCATVTVTNTGAAAGNWTVSLPIMGLINNIWNATATPSGQTGQTTPITFVGVSWNQHLAPGATTSFGFCAQR